MATTFPSFTKLPTELRLKIWKDTLPGPRTIDIRRQAYAGPTADHRPCDKMSRHNGDRLPDGSLVWLPCMPAVNRYHYTRCTATTQGPDTVVALLRTCRESRAEVSNQYLALFSPEFGPKSTMKSFVEPLFRLHYFDPSRDNVFLDEIWPWTNYPGSPSRMRNWGNRTITRPTGIYDTKHLSIECNAWWGMWKVVSKRKSLLARLQKFRKLDELSIIVRIVTDRDATDYSSRSRLSIDRPHNIPFPSPDVDIRKEDIVEQFVQMKKNDPRWRIPTVKLIAWGTVS